MIRFGFRQQQCILLLITILLSSKWSSAANSSANVSRPRRPYCGIHCLYVVMKLFDKKINAQDLVKPEYIGFREGSSMEELKKAANDNGLYALAVNNLTSRELRNLKHPVILHVKPSANEAYTHYVLFLGDKDGTFKILDPPNPVEAVPYYKLAQRWDGNGLIVSSEPINLSKIFAPARKRFTLFAGIVIAAIILVKAAGKYLSGKVKQISKLVLLGFSAVQSAGLVVAALLVGVVYHFANDEGFLAHAGATEPVVKASFGRFIPKLSANDVKNANGAVVIDARRAADYDAGHIEGAINIPTTLCAAGRNAKLGNAPKDSRIIIYCQSAGCPYAETVAAHLTEDGFNNLAIYKGGWVDWQKTEQKNETK